MTASLVDMRGITKTFPGVNALQKVDFSLRAGEVHALLGENGAGKSTLMRVLSGEIPADAGEILLDGRPVHYSTPRAAQALGIAIIHQELNLCKHLTVAENIFLGREDAKAGFLSSRSINQRAQQMLDSLNLDIAPGTLVQSLPVSKQQMVEIAKAMSTDARILIMDEPTSALTEKEIEDMFRLVRQLKAKGCGVIYISHRLEELQHIADRVTILRDGRYIATVNYADITLREIIGHMVGRELTEKFPRVESKLGEALLEVERLSAGDAVRDVSFSLRSGEILGFAGLMGAGRTELVRALFGADRKSSGTVRIGGRDVRIASPRAAIRNGLFCVPEDRKKDGLCVRMSLEANIALPNMENVLNAGMISKRKQRSLARRMIDSLTIKTPSADQLVKNLSGGNQQKVVVAKWLARDARIVMFDEPTRGIDVAAKVEIYHLMNRLKQQGVGVLFVSSELPEIMGMADRVLVMCEGRVTAELEPGKTTQEEILHYATQYGATEVIPYAANN